MNSLLKQVFFALLFLIGGAYIVLFREVEPNDPFFLAIWLVALLSIATIFFWLLLTVMLIRGRAKGLAESAEYWFWAAFVSSVTLLFYTFVFRMGGVRISGEHPAVVHDASNCFFYATLNWVTAGYGAPLTSPSGSTMHLLESMEALTGGLSMVGLIFALIAQIRIGPFAHTIFLSVSPLVCSRYPVAGF